MAVQKGKKILNLLRYFAVISGLEIKFSVQWTAGPPVLKIWWSGFDSVGPMKF